MNAIFFTDFTNTVTVQKTLGAYKCAHELRKYGYSCLVVDHLHTFSIEEMLKVLRNTVSDKTFMIGISTTFLLDTDVKLLNNSEGYRYNPLNMSKSFCPQGPEFEKVMVAEIRKLNPNCRIVVGGSKTQQQLNNKNIDFAIIGHGEISVPKLMDHFVHGHPAPCSVRNLWGVQIIDDADAKKYNFATGHMAWLDQDVVNAKVLPLESARGCIFNCKFCRFPMRGKKGLDYVRSADSIYRELKENYERWGITTYSFMDDTFNDNDEKLDQILSAVERLNFQPIFWSYARLDLMSLRPERLGKMYDIGVRAVYLGIETMNDRTGRIVGKGHDRNKQIDTIRELRNCYGNTLMMHGSFIIGLPEESIESIQLTFDALMDETIPLHTFNFKALRIDRNLTAWPSEFDLNYEKYGYVDQNPLLPLELDWKNPYMTRAQAIELEHKFSQTSQAGDRFHIPGITMWELINYGYDFETLSNMKNNQLDWYKITQQKEQYVQQYKNILFSHID
jgi:hypothetical protein